MFERRSDSMSLPFPLSEPTYDIHNVTPSLGISNLIFCFRNKYQIHGIYIFIRLHRHAYFELNGYFLHRHQMNTIRSHGDHDIFLSRIVFSDYDLFFENRSTYAHAGDSKDTVILER